MSIKPLRHSTLLGGSRLGEGYQPLTPEWRQVQENFEDTQYNVTEAETQLTLLDTRVDALEDSLIGVYKSIVEAEGTSTSTSYAKIGSTPGVDQDQCSDVVVPENALVMVVYSALARTNVGGNSRVGLFIDSTQAKIGDVNVEGSVVGAINYGHVATGPPTTNATGLSWMPQTGSDSTVVGTGQVVGHTASGGGTGGAQTGGPLMLHLDAGTYDFSIQWDLPSAGTIYAKERRLWVIVLDATALAAMSPTALAGDGLVANGGTLDVNVDGSTIEINADTLRVKDLGITNAKIAANVDAVKLSTGVVSNTEFDYLNGVTSAIQTQLDAKASTASLSSHESDTTSVHGIADTSTLYRSGGTDVAVADGGTGASNASGARTNLGLVIGTDVQAYNAKLAQIAGLSLTNDDLLQQKSGALTNRTVTQVATDLSAVHKRLAPVLAMADSNINIASAPADIDGLTDAGRYLLYGQTDPAENGPYDWNGSAGSALTRTTDCAAGIAAGGLETYVLGGTYALSTRINRNSGTVGDGGDQWDEPFFITLSAAEINADNINASAATIGGLDIVGYYSGVATSDTASTSTTITQIITMGDGVTQIPIGDYDFTAYIQFQSSNAANGISFRIGAAAGISWTNYGWETNCGATTTSGVVKTNYATTTIDSVAVANTDYWIKIEGSVSLSSALTNFFLGIACEHATLYTTTVYKGTNMILRPTTI